MRKMFGRRVIMKAMTNKKPPVIWVTQEYADKVTGELERLEAYREEVLVRLQDAREKGDLSENGAYTAAKSELRDTDRKLKHLRFVDRFGQVIAGRNDGAAGFGNQVELEAEGKRFAFTLVSKFEANPSERKLSIDSPFGQAVMGKKEGDTVAVQAPAGTKHYTIAKVS